MPIIPIVESALGLAAIEAMMMHPSVLQCAFGHLDFSLDIGADPQWDSLHYARGRDCCCIAPRAKGIAA